MNRFHAANRDRWNLASPGWAAMHDRRGTWREVHEKPELVFTEKELGLLRAVENTDVCVLGSGDNLAVFALAGMGARVTSVDLSSAQLEVAERRAEELGLVVDFVEADVTDLSVLEDARFDFVYTGGHVAVWVSDLSAYYREAVRILRQDGLLLIHEYHPFRRVWKELEDRLEVGFNYFDNGPHEYHASEELFDRTSGSVVQYEFHWTVSQYFNAVVEQGIRITCFDEIGDEPEGWEVAPLGGLPHMLLIAGRKT
ncbi:MAG: class I SAM-dependent methyltransferase [bacterium]|nr:class I SAM-dependent methyltransferase [bacterium]